MAYRGHYSSGRSSYSGGGFVNHRTGVYVSAARAHQHVGQSFGGFTKARSSAEALAAASGKRLGEVRQIRYNRPTGGYSYPGDFCMERVAATDSEQLPNLNPEPIEVACSVDVDWWLE